MTKEEIKVVLDGIVTTVNAFATTATDLVRRFAELRAALDVVEPAPPPPSPPPAPTPLRARDAVTKIVLEEFAKQTVVVPGGGDIVTPTKAIQLWTSMAIAEMNAFFAPEIDLRQQLAIKISWDVDQYGMQRTGPRPDGAPIPVTFIDGRPFVDTWKTPEPRLSGGIALPSARSE